MRGLLSGVVKDHRLPSDYKLNLNQPVTSKRFMKDFKRAFYTRMITRQYATLPLFLFYFVVTPFFFLQSYLRMKNTGSLPQIFQPRYYLYRNSHGLYGHQHNENANPDNFWDRMHHCWTSDPACGLDVGPKRPWLDLKDPTKNLVKFKFANNDGM